MTHWSRTRMQEIFFVSTSVVLFLTLSLWSRQIRRQLSGDADLSNLDVRTNSNTTTIEETSKINISLLPKAIEVNVTPINEMETTSATKTVFKRRALRLSKYSGFIPVAWSSAGGEKEINSFQLFSAYYDNRNVSQSKAAITVLGYAISMVQKRPLYCKFKYEDGNTECLKTPLVMESIATCLTVDLGGVPYFFRCVVDHFYHIPITVRISDHSNCTSQFTSNEILVGNRKIDHSARNDFGICVGGALMEQNITLQDVIEFVSLSQILGAKLITIYVSLKDVNSSMIEHLLSRYPKLLRFVEWRSFRKWYPLHYHGQFLLIHDCLYRSMYEVKYLFVQDLDEMFVPAEDKLWSEMVKKLPNLAKGVGFRFQNFFFSSASKSTPVNRTKSNSFKDHCNNNLDTPKYLTRTLHHKCFPGYRYRSKFMIKPSYVVDVAVHWVCKVLAGFNGAVDVPTNVGFLGHFRTTVPEDCLKVEAKPARENLWAAKFTDALHERICQTNT